MKGFDVFRPPNDHFCIGFTGTQKGMTYRQKESIEVLLCKALEHYVVPVTVRHGDCVGADAEFHKIAVMYPRRVRQIYIHPPIKTVKRAFCHGGAVTVLPPEKYLDRNKKIVQHSHVLLAAPKEDLEELRSGTWSTVRAAKKMERPTIVVLSNGNVLIDEFGRTPCTHCIMPTNSNPCHYCHQALM